MGRGSELVEEGRASVAALPHPLRVHYRRAEVFMWPGQEKTLGPHERDWTREAATQPCQSQLPQRYRRSPQNQRNIQAETVFGWSSVDTIDCKHTVITSRHHINS